MNLISQELINESEASDMNNLGKKRRSNEVPSDFMSPAEVFGFPLFSRGVFES